MRLYIVTDNDTKTERLIDAGNPAQARLHATKTRFTTKLADQRDVARLVKAGVEVEECKTDDAP